MHVGARSFSRPQVKLQDWVMVFYNVAAASVNMLTLEDSGRR